MDEKYIILVKDIYTDEERVVSISYSDVCGVRELHKESLKYISRQEDIKEIHLGEKLLYNIEEGFLD